MRTSIASTALLVSLLIEGKSVQIGEIPREKGGSKWCRNWTEGPFRESQHTHTRVLCLHSGTHKSTEDKCKEENLVIRGKAEKVSIDQRRVAGDN